MGDIDLERDPARFGTRLWYPATLVQVIVGLGLALVLPWLALWATLHVATFERFPGSPFLIATVAATLVGRFSASLVAALSSVVLIGSADFATRPGETFTDAELLIAAGSIVALAFVVACALALKDKATGEASKARGEIEDLAVALAEERNTMHQILQQMPNGVLIADAKGAITMANPRAEEILGVSDSSSWPAFRGDSLPWTARRADGSTYGVDEYPIARSLSVGETVIGELIAIERADGSTISIEVDSAPIRGYGTESLAGAVTVFQDVSDRLETHVQLGRTAQRLQQIQAVTDVTLSGLGFDELAERLLSKVREVLRTDSATLLVLDRSGSVLHEHMTVGVDAHDSTMQIPVGSGIAGTIASTVAPLVADDVSVYKVVRPWIVETMRSLMGVPLVYRGRVKGVLHVATRAERRFSPEEVELLELVANRIASALERASLYDSRSAMSSALQHSLLPSSLPRIEGVGVAALYRPFSPDDEIGGDFYDVFPHGEGTWGVIVGDVSGKGPEAAAIMGLAAHSVHVLARYEQRPSTVLRSLNEMLLEEESVASERFCTACHMRLRVDDDHVRVTMCVAGHPLPFLVRAGGDVEHAGEPGTLLGAFADPVLHDRVVDLAPGDALVAYTDGLIEHRGVSIDQGQQRLAELLRSCAGGRADAIVRRIEAEMVDDVALDDDIAVVVIAKV